jgi:hypothetical protein
MGLMRTSLSGSSWSFSWIQTTQLEGSKYFQQFAIFKDGCRIPEDWIKWVMAFREIENLMPMKEPADKTKMFRTLLRVKPYPTLNIIS